MRAEYGVVKRGQRRHGFLPRDEVLQQNAGVAMMIPGGALVGGGLYLGALAYENREAIGQAASAGWNKLKSFF